MLLLHLNTLRFPKYKVQIIDLNSMKSQNANLYDCEDRFSQNWFSKEWKFGKQGRFAMRSISDLQKFF